jgi:hypothetical protein
MLIPLSYTSQKFSFKDFFLKNLKLYDTTTTKYQVSLFYFKKFSQIFFEIFSYFPFLPPPPTGLVSQIYYFEKAVIFVFIFPY